MKKIFIFTITYPIASIIFEALLRLAGFTVPEDANIMAFLLLIVPTGIAVALAKYRTTMELTGVILITLILTLSLSTILENGNALASFGIRCVSGLFASLMTYGFTKKRG